MEVADVLDPRVVIVTGKGGVGKSTIAAALAVAAVRSGRRTCLVEVEGRQTMARLFSTEPWNFDERSFRPDLFGMSIDPEASLLDYLQMFYGARRLSRLVVGSPAVDFATSAAPGIKDVLLIGKVREMERRREPDGRFTYDLIVVDAPPTGRIVNFLRAPDATTELVSVGPIHSQAQSVVDMLLDGTRTHVQLVTLLEEMPVQETLESARALTELGVTLGPVIVNRVLTERFDERAAKVLDDGLSPRELAAMLSSAGLEIDLGAAAALHALGAKHLQTVALQRRLRQVLNERLQLPLIELGFQHTPAFGETEIGRLADTILELVA
ncbi:MAG: ArsA family ATPase [Egibacteraceae bacterium]